MSQTTSVAYKQKILRVEQLRNSSRQNIHQRVRLLVDIFADEEFRADHHDLDDFGLAELLDAYLEDTALTFREAQRVLEKYPKYADWQTKSLRELYAEATAEDAADVKEPTGRTRRSATIKELEASEQRVKDYEARLKFSETNQERLAKELNEALAENRRLVVEVALLEGRISELERTVVGSRQSVVSSRV